MTKHIDIRNKRGSAKDLALTPTERELLYKELKNPQDRIIFLLGCYGGLRAEEIGQCRFTWLKKSILNDMEVLEINIPNEDKDTRRAYKTFKQKKEWNTSIYIFDSRVINELWFYYMNNPNGLQVSRQSILRYNVKIHMAKILNRRLTIHGLRATHSSYMLQEFRFSNNVKPDIFFIKTQLRHKDLKTTMKHYNAETKANQEAYLKGVLNK